MLVRFDPITRIDVEQTPNGVVFISKNTAGERLRCGPYDSDQDATRQYEQLKLEALPRAVLPAEFDDASSIKVETRPGNKKGLFVRRLI